MINKEKAYTELKKMHPNAECELNFKTPFELLVAVILSAQCTDKRVNIATERLFKVYNTPEQFASLSIKELEPYIFSCGFYNNKGKNIIAASKAIVERFSGEVPRTMEELLTLDGVGRKTANVVLGVAFQLPSMPVDTHVFRVSRRLLLSDSPTVEGVERDLCEGFPREQWNSLHHLLIFHGRYVCKSQKPDCGSCSLREECGYYQENK